MIVIYSCVRNETRILEWVKYYYKIGVQHIILLDDNDYEDNTLQQTLQSINPSLLTIIKDNSKTNIERIKCMYSHSDENWNTHIEPCLIKLKATYLFKIDADEFLYLNKFKNIQEMISFYEPFDSILINWLIFGGSYLKKNDKNTITNIFIKSNDILNIYVKSLAKVSNIINFNNNAHTFRLKENSIVKDIDNNTVNFNQNNRLNMENITTHKLSDMSFKNRIYIAHYICQDYYTFIQRKFLNNISEIYFSYEFFKHIPENDKLLFKEYFMNHTELSLEYMNKLHLSKAVNHPYLHLKKSNIRNIFNTPIKKSLKIMLDAIIEYYCFADNGGNKIYNYHIVNSL